MVERRSAANDPAGDSVTRHFSSRGWSGINLGPILQRAALGLVALKDRHPRVKRALKRITGLGSRPGPR